MNDLEQLAGLFQRTQESLQKHAARAVDASLVVRNWLFGWYLVEFENADANRTEIYGKKLLPRLAALLKAQGFKGLSTTSLKQCRLFYLANREIGQTPSDQSLPASQSSDPDRMAGSALQPEKTGRTPSVESHSHLSTSFLQQLATTFPLGWSQYVTLLTLDDPAERRFYEIESQQNQWSVRELDRQISSSLYQRLALSRDKDEIRRFAEEGQLVEKAADLIKNPLILEFLDLQESTSYSESDLESAIIDKLETFLLELGKGFLFEARQKRFTFDNDHFFVDLVFYNRLLRCYVLIDLKRDKLTHQDLGQMQMYVNYFDRHVKLPDELPTIGIVLCNRKNETLVELTLPEDANIFASKYQLYLPSKEELKEELEAITTSLEGSQA